MVDEEDGAKLSPNVATFITKRFVALTADKKLKSKLELYKRPANCKVLTALLTNKKIWRTLKTPAKRTDVKLTNVQKNMAKATIAMAKCADELALRADYKDKLTSLTVAITLLGHTHKSITNLRRESMRYAHLHDLKSLESDN
ncbi:transposon Ty3-I Gag-Pol polyprotein [Elysia marginata]|uniref:Transposon Ty3-I Gag-Pol polyprotein n=1 Tax=Elysia marginata TaxID=1093978 RepID=A0AAV4J6C1_9GAST|nr:transposon Ty3-I Gag-Pol polyprotein [Elysia marginata]